MDYSPTRKLNRGWLAIGVTALAIAGLFSLVLVVARTPAISELPGFKSLFHQALVVHVDLSVLLWFLSAACLLWSLGVSHTRPPIPGLEEAAQISFGLGMAAIALSPLDTAAEPLMSNYIPVLMTPLFFLGLGLVLAGVVLMLARLFCGGVLSSEWPIEIRYGLFAGGIIAVMAIASFVWSFMQMPQNVSGGLSPHEYFEIGFWGGGHVLQFLHTEMLLVCWLMVSGLMVPGIRWGRWLMKAILSVGLAAALLSPLAYWLYTVE
ncbi:MAG: hypothetical protein K2Q01_04825, partial [Rickettsiales bacterium]|nr:hypothetical protein [Rickettsiales bacterium]